MIASVAILGAGDQLAGDVAVGVVLAHQHVNRGMTAVGLALVDQQAGVVVEFRNDRIAVCIQLTDVEHSVAVGIDGEIAGRVGQGAAAQHHHVCRRTGGTRIIERVARRQRGQCKAATLGDEVEAVVEELAEHCKEIVEGNAAEDAGVRDEGGLRRADDAVANVDSLTAHLHHGRVRRRIVGRARRVDVGIGDELGGRARRGARRGNRGLGELSREIGRHDKRLAVFAKDRGAVTTIDDLHRHRVERKAVRRAVVGVVGGEDSQEIGVGLAPIAVQIGARHEVAVGVETADEIVVFARNLANPVWIQWTKELGVIVPDIDLLREVVQVGVCEVYGQQATILQRFKRQFALESDLVLARSHATVSGSTQHGTSPGRIGLFPCNSTTAPPCFLASIQRHNRTCVYPYACGRTPVK